jgi:hypothetical protein
MTVSPERNFFNGIDTAASASDRMDELLNFKSSVFLVFDGLNVWEVPQGSEKACSEPKHFGAVPWDALARWATLLIYSY